MSPLGACNKLKILTIDGLKLAEIDLSPLSHCIELEFLKLDDNEIASLDVTSLFECTSLTNFQIDRIQLTTTLIRDIEEWPEGVRKHRKRFRSG